MNKRLYLAYSTDFLYVCVCLIACVSCLCPLVIVAQALTTVSLHYSLKPLLWATAKGLQVVLHTHTHNPLGPFNTQPITSHHFRQFHIYN